MAATNLVTKLSAIGDAIRSKTGTTELLALDAMPTAIEGISTGGDIPAEKFKLTGDCSYMFASPSWNWYIEEFGDKITTEDIKNANYMFKDSSVETIPFDFNFNGSQNNVVGMFAGCDAKEMGKISNLQFYTMEGMFSDCVNLKYLPEFENLDMSGFKLAPRTSLKNTFYYCISLRAIPEGLLNKLYNNGGDLGTNSLFNGLAYLFSMDEIKGLNPPLTRQDDNMFSSFGSTCCRWKEVTFMMNEDGTPIDVDWSNQTISLAGVGYAPLNEIMYDNDVNHINNGITADKEVTDAASYQALKNDADWFTCDIAYSRYNHDSAVNTLNSLPNIALGSGNIIKFNSEMGSQTDERGVGTMTDSELAVAIDKGWTVSFI